VGVAFAFSCYTECCAVLKGGNVSNRAYCILVMGEMVPFCTELQKFK